MSLAIQAVVASLVFVAGLATGIKFESGEVAKLRLAHSTALVAAVEGARAQEQARFTKVQEAQNVAAKSAQSARAAAVSARAESRSLRDDLAAARQAADQSLSACAANGATVDRLFDQCAGRYQGMAEAAQGHANDVRLLLDAWPK